MRSAYTGACCTGEQDWLRALKMAKWSLRCSSLFVTEAEADMSSSILAKLRRTAPRAIAQLIGLLLCIHPRRPICHRRRRRPRPFSLLGRTENPGNGSRALRGAEVVEGVAPVGCRVVVQIRHFERKVGFAKTHPISDLTADTCQLAVDPAPFWIARLKTRPSITPFPNPHKT